MSGVRCWQVVDDEVIRVRSVPEDYGVTEH